MAHHRLIAKSDYGQITTGSKSAFLDAAVHADGRGFKDEHDGGDGIGIIQHRVDEKVAVVFAETGLKYDVCIVRDAVSCQSLPVGFPKDNAEGQATS